MSVLEDAYRQRYEMVLQPLASAIEDQLREYFVDEPRVDRIVARAKSIDKFMVKANTKKNGKLKYSEPLRQIQDQIGARIITFYMSDVERVCNIINKYYRKIESKHVVPESEWEFGYFGTHYVLLVPSEVVYCHVDRSLIPEFFELQIKTLFQHAWSEANHDLGYKPGMTSLNSEQKRLLAFSSAQAWGADHVFDRLFEELMRSGKSLT